MKKRTIYVLAISIALLIAINLASAYHIGYYDQTSNKYIQDNSYLNSADSVSSSIDYRSNQERIIIKKESMQSYEPRYQYLVEYKYRPIVYYRYYDVYMHPDYYVYPSTDYRYKRDRYYKKYYYGGDDDDYYYDDYYYSLVKVSNKRCNWHQRYYRQDC